MSVPVTEICIIPLKPDVDLTTGDTQKQWEESLNTIDLQPGCKSIFWGRKVEDPDKLLLVIDWENLQSHKNFMNDPIYGPFVEKLLPLVSAPHFLYHVSFGSTTAAYGPLSAPVTECVTMYFEPDYPNSAYDANFAKFLELATKTADTAQGVAGGWGIEEHQHEKFGATEGEKGPAKVFNMFVGWPSVEEHLKYREHEAFPVAVGYLREGAKAADMFHVKFQKH